MTTQAPTPSKVDAPYDIELEQSMDDERLAACRFNDGPATALSMHGTCHKFVCSKHAEIARQNIADALAGECRLYCSVCHMDPIDPASMTVRPI